MSTSYRLEERHVLVAHDTGDDTLVTMAAGHLVTHLQLTLLGDVDLGHLDNAGLRELVTVGDVVLLAFDDGIGLLPLDGIIINGSFDQRIGMGIARPLARAEVQVTHHHARLLVGRLAGDLLKQFLRELRACGIEFHAEVVGDARLALPWSSVHSLATKRFVSSEISAANFSSSFSSCAFSALLPFLPSLFARL